MNSNAERSGTAVTATHSPRADYLPFVDGLRAIAVIAVIVYHLRPILLPGGFAGVDVFFVVSGFVVSASVSHWDWDGLKELLSYFYARRMQRIAPALVVCLLATGLGSAMFIPAAWLSSSNDLTGLFAFVGLSNFYLAANQDNYFSPLTDFNPYTHTWSLGVEEQFYLVFPLLFFAWTRGGRWRTLTLGLFGLALIASLGDAWQRAQVSGGATFYLITTRFWELASGVLLYLCLSRFAASDRTTPRWRGIRETGAWIALVLLGYSLWASVPAEFPYPGAWMPVVATLGLLGLVQRENTHSLLSRGLCGRAMIAIGRRSYSLYLWHWPVLVVLRWTSGVNSALALVAALVMTILFAELSYRFVEAPLRYSPTLRQWTRIRVLATGMFAIAACAIAAAGLIKGRSVISLSTVTRHADEWYPESLNTQNDASGCSLQKSKRENALAQSRIYTRTDCPAQSGPAASAIFALGDSHTLSYVTMLSEYVLRTGASVTLYPNPGCSYANLRSVLNSDSCRKQHLAILDDIAAHARQGDILFLAALRLNRISEQDEHHAEADVLKSLDGEQAEQVRREAEITLTTQLRPLRSIGMRIVFEAPKPLLPSPPFRCSDAFNADNPACAEGFSISRDALETYRAPVVASLKRIATQLDASIWDPFPLLCPGSNCTAVSAGHPILFDGDHISAYANRLLYPSFATFVISRPVPER
jgi:peptidoglycan/LPS O-acetylase OafA/YrhL